MLVRGRVTLRVGVGFGHLSALYHLLGSVDAVRGEEEYTAAGVLLPVGLYPEDAPAFAQAITNATSGGATVEVV